MYLSSAVQEEGNYFSYPTRNQSVIDNAKVCLGGFSGSTSEYQMYKSNCADLMTETCSSNWSEACNIYQSNLNKLEQDLFQQSLSFRQKTLPMNSYNSCNISSRGILPGQTELKGINPIVIGDTEIVMPLSCPFQTREGYKPVQYKPQSFNSLHQLSPQPFTPGRPSVEPPAGTPQPFVPMGVQSLNTPQPFSPDRPSVEPPAGTPQPFIPQSSQVLQNPLPTTIPFMPSLSQNIVPQATVPPNPIVNVEPVNPIGTPIPFYPIPSKNQLPVQQNLSQPMQSHQLPVQQNLSQPMQSRQLPVQQNLSQPMKSRQLPVQQNLSQPMKSHQQQMQQNLSQPMQQNLYQPMQQNLSQPMQQNLYQPMQSHQQTMQQSHRLPVQQNLYQSMQSHQQPMSQSALSSKKVTFSDQREETIQKILEGPAEEECHTACSISKIFQQ